MPALFAYLIAVGLLLGGGYGALSWLAAPEPVKVVAKAKPKPPSAPHEVANAEPPPASLPDAARLEQSEQNAPSIDNSDRVAAVSNDQPSSQHEASEHGAEPASEHGAGPEVAESAQGQKALLAHAEIPAAAADKEPTQHVDTPPRGGKQEQEEERRRAQAAMPASPGNVAAIAPAAPTPIARTAKRRHLRQASHHPQKHPLALMTLRTIEFPDGRRVTQLFPYRGGERAMAFEPDE